MMILLILVGVSFILFYHFLAKTHNYWKDRNVLYENPYPVFGNLLKVAIGKEAISTVINRLYNTFDGNVPYFGVFVFQRPFLVVKDPEFIKDVLIKDFSSFANRQTYANKNIDPISANVLFSLKNEEWRDLRSKMTPIFTSGKMKMMLPMMKKVTDELERYLERVNEKEIDVRNICQRYSIDTITSCAFGIDSNSIENENSSIKIMVNRLLDVSSLFRAFSIFSFFFCPIFVKIFRLSFSDRTATDYMVNVFKDASEERLRTNVKRYDLIDCLHTIEKKETVNDIFKLDLMKKAAQAIIFFNAGSEPSTLIISYLLYEVALNPDIQNRLRAEIRENIDSGGSISYEALNEMKYLDMVTKETLRKYPLTQLLSREASVDYTFKETGLKIQKGTPILIPMSALHFDPKYFPRPEIFDPERFQDDWRGPKCAFIPFGEGPRKCIGERFAKMQVKIAVAMFLKNFEVTPSQKTEVPLKLSEKSFFLAPATGQIHLNVRKIE